MYVRLTHPIDSVFPLLIFLFALAFAGSVVGLYCQQWGISGTRAKTGWDLKFDFKYFYGFRYKLLDLGGVSSLSLGSKAGSGSGRRAAGRLNTLAVETANGGGAVVTHLIPYGMPDAIPAFIDRVNARLADPAESSFQEKLVFNPFKMGDVFFYVFGGFFVLILLLFVLFALGVVGGLVAPAFIKAEYGNVEYRARLATKAATVPFSQIKNFEVATDITPSLILNLKDGSRVPFYRAAKDAAAAQALADSLNRAVGTESR